MARKAKAIENEILYEEAVDEILSNDNNNKTSTLKLKPNLEPLEDDDKELDKAIKLYDDFMYYLSNPGFQVNAFPMGAGHKGGIAGKVVLHKYMPTPISDPQTGRPDVLLLFYYIGKPGKYKFHIRSLGHTGGLQGTFHYVDEITPQDISQAYQKYNWIDKQIDLKEQTIPFQQAGMGNVFIPQVQNHPFFGGRDHSYGDYNYERNYQPPQVDVIRLLELYSDKFDKLFERIEQKQPEKLFDSDTMKLILVTQGQEAMMNYMKAMLEVSKSNRGDDNKTSEMLNILNTNSQNTMQILTSLITNNKGGSIGELAQMTEIFKGIKELSNDGGDKSTMEMALNSPVLASGIQGIMSMLSSKNEQKQEQTKLLPNNNLNPDIINAINQLANVVGDIQKQLNEIKQGKLPAPEDKSVPAPPPPPPPPPPNNFKKHEKEYDDFGIEDLQKAISEGDINMMQTIFNRFRLFPILTDFLQDKTDTMQTIELLNQERLKGDKIISNMLNELDTDPTSKEKILKQLEPLSGGDNKIVLKVGLLIDYYLIYPVLQTMNRYIKGEKDLSYVVDKLILEADDNDIVADFLNQLDDNKRDEVVTMLGMIAKDEMEHKKMIEVVDSYLSLPKDEDENK